MNSAKKLTTDSALSAEDAAIAPRPRSDVVIDREPRFVRVPDSAADFDAAVAQLEDPRLSSRERARGVLAIVRAMIRAETGQTNSARALGDFLDRLWGGPALAVRLQSIVHRATALSQGRVGEGLAESHLVRDLEEIAAWYGVRRASLAACRREGFQESDPDCLFHVRVSPDAERWGRAGLSVECGLRFIARAHETLWFKVMLRRGREYVGTRAGWSSWRDETDSVLTDSPAQGRFAALVPIRPNQQRTVIDSVVAFVPYDALDLPSDRLDVEIDAGVYTQSGELIVSVAIPEMLRLGERRTDIPAMVSPQAIGVWDRNPVTGDEVSAMCAQARLDGEPGWEEQVIEITCDVSIHSRGGERLTVEARLRRLDGTSLELIDRGDGAAFEPPVSRTPLRPQHTAAHFHGLRTVIPLAEYELTAGPQQFLAEIVVTSEDGGVICGAMAPVACAVQRANHRTATEPSPVSPAAPIDGAVEVRDIRFAPAACFGAEGVVIETAVAVHDWENDSFRMAVALETEDGRALLNAANGESPVVRTFWFGAEPGLSAGSIRPIRVFFDGREFARFVKTLPSTERRIVARTSVFSSAGTTLFEATRSIAGDAAADVKAALPPERAPGPVRIIGIELLLDGGPTDSLSFGVTLNVLRGGPPLDRCTFYYEFLDAAGQPIAIRNELDSLAGDVVTTPLPFSGSGGGARWFQTRVQLACRRPAGWGFGAPAALRLTSFSPAGEYWETVQESLSFRPEMMRRITSAADGDTAAGPAASSSAAASGGASFAPSLMSRLRAALIG